MKKLLSSILCVMLLLSLGACSVGQGKTGPYDVKYVGRVYTVDEENHTVTVDGHVCQYELTGSGDHISMSITYPDGSTYHWSRAGNVESGGGSDDYKGGRYASGQALWHVLTTSRSESRGLSGNLFLGAVLVLLGLFAVLSPKNIWYLSWGWRYKGAEPSDAALMLERLGGVVVTAVGLLVCFGIIG